MTVTFTAEFDRVPLLVPVMVNVPTADGVNCAVCGVEDAENVSTTADVHATPLGVRVIVPVYGPGVGVTVQVTTCAAFRATDAWSRLSVYAVAFADVATYVTFVGGVID